MEIQEPCSVGMVTVVFQPGSQTCDSNGDGNNTEEDTVIIQRANGSLAVSRCLLFHQFFFFAFCVIVKPTGCVLVLYFPYKFFISPK